MMDIPLVTFQALSDQPNMVFVHQGDKVRRFSASDDDQIRNTLRNVFIAEFGIPQEEAIHAAADVVEQRQAKVVQDAAVLTELEDTKRELTAETERRIKAESDLSLAQGDIKVGRETIEHLTSELDEMKALLEKARAEIKTNTQGARGEEIALSADPANTGETGTAGRAAVGTKPEGQTPPAQQTDTTPEPGGGVSTPAGETPPAETDPPQTKSGAAPIEAVTGGTEGKTDG